MALMACDVCGVKVNGLTGLAVHKRRAHGISGQSPSAKSRAKTGATPAGKRQAEKPPLLGQLEEIADCIATAARGYEEFASRLNQMLDDARALRAAYARAKVKSVVQARRLKRLTARAKAFQSAPADQDAQTAEEADGEAAVFGNENSPG